MHVNKLRTLLVLFAALALTVGVATASADDGNSENAKLCQQDGWQDLVSADGTRFANQGDCVSYAAQGGTPMSAAQQWCQSIGGTYSIDPATAGFIPVIGMTVLWTCNGVHVADYSTFVLVCLDSGGNTMGSALFYSTCGRF